MNTVLVMLGSNVNVEYNIDLAKRNLSDFFRIVDSSSLIFSMPVGNHYKSPFANNALKLTTHLRKNEIVTLFKSIEIKMGRTAESKQNGIIPIDIDLIFWNNILEHEDYNIHGYVKECIDQLL